VRDFDDFDSIFRRLFKDIEKMNRHGNHEFSGFDKFKENIREPLVDLTENEKEVKVTIELPGVDKRDIDVRVKGNMLVIKSTINKSKQKDNDNILYKERSYQQYYRTVPLPDYVDDKHINAKYNNGILEVTLPKLKKDKKEAGKIQVK